MVDPLLRIQAQSPTGWMDSHVVYCQGCIIQVVYPPRFVFNAYWCSKRYRANGFFLRVRLFATLRVNCVAIHFLLHISCYFSSHNEFWVWGWRPHHCVESCTKHVGQISGCAWAVHRHTYRASLSIHSQRRSWQFIELQAFILCSALSQRPSLKMETANLESRIYRHSCKDVVTSSRRWMRY